MKFKVNNEVFDEIEIGEIFITNDELIFLKLVECLKIDEQNIFFSFSVLDLKKWSDEQDRKLILSSKELMDNLFIMDIEESHAFINYSTDLKGSEDGFIPDIIGRFMPLKEKIKLL